MKKVVVIFLAFAFLFFPLISSAEITLLNLNENLSQGETLIAKVSGNFIDIITNQNIFFYKGQILDQNFRVSMEHSVEKIGDDFYIYALTSGKTSDYYSISVENVQYMKGTEVVSDKIIKNFSITNELAHFSLKPGFVVASGDFSVEVQNLKENEITITADTMINNSGVRKIFVSDSSTQNSIVLKSGEIKKINFQLSEGSPALQNIELSSENFTYHFPVYLSTSSGVVVHEEAFRIEPSDLSLTLDTNSTTKKSVRIYNTGDKAIKDISLSLSSSLSPYIILSKTKIETLEAKTNVVIELALLSKKEIAVEGTLKAVSGSLNATLDLSVNFSKTITPATNITSQSVKTCAELGGVLYETRTQKCSGQTNSTKDGWCCFGTTSKLEEDSTGKIIAIVIVLIIIVGIVWFYFAKFRKAKKPVDLLKVAQPKTSGFFSKK